MRDKLIQMVEKKNDLPPLPEILRRLEEKIDDPDSCIEDISELIQTEPVLRGRLMKLANSVFFGGGRDQADDLNSAVGRLGLKMVLDLAYTLELPNLFVNTKGFNQIRFWHHALVVAVCSRSISRLLEKTVEEQTHAYTAGLMHDIGIMVFAYLIPDQYADFLSKGKSVNKLLEVQEQDEFGISHPELGAIFIGKWWPVDPSVVASVKYHHLSLDQEEEATPVIVANRIANSQGILNGTNIFIEPEEEDIGEQIGLSPEETSDVIDEAQEALNLAQDLLAR